jgi:hypothetical protein
MANQGYAYSLSIRTGQDEQADNRAWVQASFCVLDDNGVVVKTQYDAEIMTLETLLIRSDTIGQGRAKLEDVARDVWQDGDLEFAWLDEG